MNSNLITDDDISGILIIDNYITYATYFVFNHLIFETSITMLSLIFQFKCYFKLLMILLINFYTQMDSGKVPINIYIDLSKAFDKLDHAILLDKLNYYGVRGVAYRLFHSYLSNRYQYVEYNGSISSTKVVDTGVPQGSTLGPLLFLISINNLPCVSPLFNMVMYAGDTTLYCNLSNNPNDNYLNSELNKISEWLSSNKLPLNVRKTKFMVFIQCKGKFNIRY